MVSSPILVTTMAVLEPATCVCEPTKANLEHCLDAIKSRIQQLSCKFIIQLEESIHLYTLTIVKRNKQNSTTGLKDRKH